MSETKAFRGNWPTRRRKDATGKVVGRSAKERFWEKVALPNDNGCMEWLGYIGTTGYGKFCYAGFKHGLAHRFSHLLNIGPIPEGLQIDHLCRNRACVAPDHLEAVTAAVNMARGTATQRSREAKRSRTHCLNGHPYMPENILMQGTTHRCRPCRKAAQDRRVQRNRELRRGAA